MSSGLPATGDRLAVLDEVLEGLLVGDDGQLRLGLDGARCHRVDGDPFGADLA
jgi:hypothetical protein